MRGSYRMAPNLPLTGCLLLILALIALPGCQMARRLSADPGPAAPQTGSDEDSPPPAEQELRDHNTKLQLRLIENASRTEELEEQLRALQRMLDAAIQEVVRTKAKLRSLESRAEAASAIAEAEVALKALEPGGTEPRPAELTQAEQLLRMSTREFEKENFGGALYLAGQVKAQVRALREKLLARESLTPLSSDEVAFELPLALTVTARSNVRKGPGLDFDVLAVLDAGSSVTGHSYRGKWLRVKTRKGKDGWIHQTLVAGRR